MNHTNTHELVSSILNVSSGMLLCLRRVLTVRYYDYFVE